MRELGIRSPKLAALCLAELGEDVILRLQRSHKKFLYLLRSQISQLSISNYLELTLERFQQRIDCKCSTRDPKPEETNVSS